MLLSITAIIIVGKFGLIYGVDFKGGSVMEISFSGDRPHPQELSDTVNGVSSVSGAAASPVGEKEALIRLNEINEKTHQEILSKISAKFGKITEARFDSVGPTVGGELKQKSIRAIIIVLLAIIVYLAFVFRKLSGVLSPWAMGLAAVFALIHDIMVPTAVFSLLGHFYGIEITAVFVAAALTILGYSVSDSVVVFDRIRENILRFGSKDGFAQVVHKSIMQTLVRSLNTNFTVLLSLLAIYFFGGESIKYFSLALIIGIFLGAYSSIFIASPILVWWNGRRSR
jgi:preprotein translocase subunit SecF